MAGKFYTIETKGKKFVINANNKSRAYKKFFENVLNGKISLDEIGLVLTIDGDYALRTVPILYYLKILDEETALANIEQLGFLASLNELREWAIEDATTLGFLKRRGRAR